MKYPTNPRDPESNRRDCRKAGAGIMTAGAIATIAIAGIATHRSQAQSGASEPSTPPPVSSPGIETQSGQAVYQLPRDHAWHGGKFYQSNEYNEWHYITILGRDVKTGERISIFWVPLAQGWMAEDARPLHNVLFAFQNLETGEFHTSMPYITGPLKTEGSAADAEDFWFKYSIDDGKNGFSTAYDYPSETWKFSGYNTKDDEWNHPFKLDMTAVLKAPGYVPMAYWGLESIGVDPKDGQNPETMHGLSFYYEPTHPEQEGYGLAGAYIEGVIQLREGSPDGPIVATGFTEMISLTEPFEDGSDPSMGPPISRGLPENPNSPWKPMKE